MKIRMLVENTSIRPDVVPAHGISLYIETLKKKILFDMGPAGLLRQNAKALGLDLAAVDLAVISHGHADHGGGLADFLQVNRRAKIYLQESAFGEYFSRRETGLSRIGLDRSLRAREQIVLLSGDRALSEHMQLFSKVSMQEFQPEDNKNLLKKQAGEYRPDDFCHEQNLLLQESGKLFLFAGCAHRGIWNILLSAGARMGRYPDVVVSGFHFYSRSRRKMESMEHMDALADFLRSPRAKFYTCHCTGQEPFCRLEEKLGKRMEYLSAGQTIEIQ